MCFSYVRRNIVWYSNFERHNMYPYAVFTPDLFQKLPWTLSMVSMFCAQRNTAAVAVAAVAAAATAIDFDLNHPIELFSFLGQTESVLVIVIKIWIKLYTLYITQNAYRVCSKRSSRPSYICIVFHYGLFLSLRYLAHKQWHAGAKVFHFGHQFFFSYFEMKWLVIFTFGDDEEK